jgi:UDP-GlcNAc:undecaprenyl-phosphate GlcNAc-1-phosphate transferase
LVVGLIDDLRGLSFHWKFAAQILAGVYAWNCGFLIEKLTNPFGGALDLGWLSLPLTVLWIVGVTNAVNLIDGLDGLAAGIALIITVAVGVLAIVRGDVGLTAASVALAGALSGFLRFNFNPARIFLGDSGSLFLGFVLAVTTVRGQKGGTAVAILAPLLILGVPLFDTGLAVLRRLYRIGNQGVRTDNALGYMVRNWDHVFRPDRGHIHHRLIDWGMTHRGAVICLYGLGTIFALAALALVVGKSHWLGLLLVAVLFAGMAIFFLVIHARARRAARGALAAEIESSSAPAEPLASSRGQL